ncbi:MAG: tetratricopeptide repeat protein [Candidatus Gracilibacteria bacterium]|nr:tetratricopeptide repeat protein [Candidatus Gracilibacteria bacterium]
MKTMSFRLKLFLALFFVTILSAGAYFLTTRQYIREEQHTPNVDTVGPLLENNINAYLSNPEKNKDPDFVAAKQSLDSNDIKGAVTLWEKVLKKDTEATKNIVHDTGSTSSNLRSQSISKLILAQTYLKYGNYYYKEKESANKAIQLLTENPDDDYGAHGMYFVGYAYEITKQYDKALEWYNKGLKISSNTDKLNAIFKNQIGHVYDLMGDKKSAFQYYDEAYKLDKKNYQAVVNIGRILVQGGKNKEAIPYLVYALGTTNTTLRSEIFYSLSSVTLGNGIVTKKSIEKSIAYARGAIASFPDYPMGYVALAKGLYMKNDKANDTEIDKVLKRSIELNPNGYEAYRIRALHEFDRGNMTGAINTLKLSATAVDKDVILMKNEQIGIKNELANLVVILGLIQLTKRDNADMSQISTILMRLPTGFGFILEQLSRGNHGVFTNTTGVQEYIKTLNNVSTERGR